MSSACALRARERLDFDYIVSHFKMSKADKKERKAEERAGGSSFSKSSVLRRPLKMHTATLQYRFQNNPLWRAFLVIVFIVYAWTIAVSVTTHTCGRGLSFLFCFIQAKSFGGPTLIHPIFTTKCSSFL